MTKKEYLRQGSKLKKEIEHDREILKELKSNLDGLQAIKLSEKVQGGPIKDDSNTVNRMNKVIELENKIKNKMYKLDDFQQKLLMELENIKNIDEKILMESKYILNLTWDQIANKICYSLSHTYRIHGRALENFKFHKNESE
jgi:DNA-directed RNA polymerase specialized sigma subunit